MSRLCCVDGSQRGGEGRSMKRTRRPGPPVRLPSGFAGFRFPPEVILLAGRWYLRYGLSYRDLEELLVERGIEVDHVTLYRWVQRFTPLLIEAARPTRHLAADRWFVDETYVKVSGVWRYVYRAVDQRGQVIDVYVSQRRDIASALAECDERDARRAVRRVHEAGFPRTKTLADFDFNANTAINPATINTLAGCGWINKGQSLCLIGDSGTGKSHLLIGLGTAAAQQGHRVRYVLAAKLVNELVEAADERQLSRTIARYGRVDLLCIDDLGYMDLAQRGAELLFQVLTEREEQNAVAIASNDSFSGWTKTFTDPRLCAAIVDRLTFGGTIIETGTSSYRLAHGRTQRAARGAKSDRHPGAKSG